MGSNAAASADDVRSLLRRSVASLRADLETDVALIPPKLAELSRRFVELDRRLPAAVRRLQELRSDEVLDAFAAAELERVLGVPGVQSAAVREGALVVVTDPVLTSGRNLGSFRVVLDLAGDVSVESVERAGPRGAWDHPHVQAGLPCLGNLREGVLKLIAEYELALAAQVMVDFLHTYVAETAYTPIEGWPVFSPGEEEEEEEEKKEKRRD